MTETSPLNVETISASMKVLVLQVLEYLPKIAAAMLILVLGWFIAKFAKIAIVRAIGGIDQFWKRLVLKEGLEQLQSRQPPARIVGEIVFWILLLVFITFATEILGLGLFVTWLQKIVAFLPLAALATFIVVVGFVVGTLARNLIETSAKSAGMVNAGALGRTAQIVVIFISVILGIGQVGINISFISELAAIVLAAMLGGLSLAFGLGSRTHVSNIIAANQLKTLFQVGDRIRIGDVEGDIVKISISKIVIDTEFGSVNIPAKLFDEQISTLTQKGT